MYYISLYIHVSKIHQCVSSHHRHQFLLYKESQFSVSSSDSQHPQFMLSDGATLLFLTQKTTELCIPQSPSSCFLSCFPEHLCVLISVCSEAVNSPSSTLTPAGKQAAALPLQGSFTFWALSVSAPQRSPHFISSLRRFPEDRSVIFLFCSTVLFPGSLQNVKPDCWEVF